VDTEGATAHGFGTTAAEWKLLHLAYDIALVVSQGSAPPEEILMKFRQQDEVSNASLESWWNSRQTF